MKITFILLTVVSLFSSSKVLSKESVKATENAKTKNDSSKRDSVRDFAIQVNLNYGAGIVRNYISPELGGSVSVQLKNKTIISAGVSSYYFFERNIDRTFKMYDNYFVNADLLFRSNKSIVKNNTAHWSGIEIGYLFKANGDYFSGSTFSIYQVEEFKYFKLKAGLIITDNFKTIFPGISILL